MVSGSARVEVVSESGREVVLYKVEPGQTCLMTTACLSSDMDYSAHGVTESEVEAVILSKQDFMTLLGHCPVFRKYILGSYGERFADFMTFVEDVLLQRVDVRLAKHLLQNRDDENIVKQTHQTIATELGTAREVISRVLKEFERKKFVKLQRGRIELTNPGGLSNIG
jgi:CRP/FNR family transcriptional regulator